MFALRFDARCCMTAVVLGLLLAGTMRSEAWAAKPDAGDQTQAAARVTRLGLLLGIGGDMEARDAELRRALRIDPNDALAHWQLGELQTDGQWRDIAQIEREMADDAQLAEYRRLRDAIDGNPKRELALAGWCARHQLHDAERLHLQRVLANASCGPAERKEAIKRLQLQPYGGVLLTKDEIAQVEAQLAKQRADWAKWAPIVQQWLTALEDKSVKKHEYTLNEVRAVKDPAAIPALEAILMPHSEELALEVISALGGMPAYAATESLVEHAVENPSKTIRDAAIAQLQQRPLHDFAPMLLQKLQTPIQSRFYVGVTSNGMVQHQHEFYREDQQAKHVVSGSYVGGPRFVPNGRSVTVDRCRIPELWFHWAQLMGRGSATVNDKEEQFLLRRAYKMRLAAELRNKILTQESTRAAQLERGVAQANAAVTQTNNRVFGILEQVAKVQLPRVPQQWWQWWHDENELYGDQKPIVRQQFGRVDPYYVPLTSITYVSCFPAGTLVHGETGPVAIERIQAGDRVLSQDLETGELAYHLVLRTTERPPSDLLQITLGDATITTTKGHPFWVNGIGWRMAKRLQIGQQLHCFGDARTIDHITTAGKAKAYNLVVADYATYFVGMPGVLVHDNTYRKPTRVLTPGLPAGDNVALR